VDVDTGQAELTGRFWLDGHGGFDYSPTSALVAGSNVWTTFLYDLDKQQMRWGRNGPALKEPGRAAHPCIAWHPSGKLLTTTKVLELPTFSAGTLGVGLWEASSGRLLDELECEAAGLAWSVDGETLLAVGRDGTLVHWQAKDGRVISTQTLFSGLVRDASFSPDRQTLALACGDNSLRTYDLATGQLLGTTLALQGPYGPMLRIGPDGHYEGSPRVWRELVHVVRLADQQVLLSADEFTERFSWQNRADESP
jgi:WD40 repeat protein